jgi:predicted anti-sigma-YlaC factor YlaD
MMTWFSRLFTRASTKKKQQQVIYPGGIPCQEVVELITGYLEDTLLPEKRAQIDEHLASCDGCSNYLEQVRLTISMLHNLAREPSFPETREDLLNVFRQWKQDQQNP